MFSIPFMSTLTPDRKTSILAQKEPIAWTKFPLNPNGRPIKNPAIAKGKSAMVTINPTLQT